MLLAQMVLSLLLIAFHFSAVTLYHSKDSSSFQGNYRVARMGQTQPAQTMSSNAINSTLLWLCGTPNATRESSKGDDLPSALAQALNTSCGFRGAAADHNFVFFKTHKTGSSTLMLMLARNVWIRRLKLVGCIFDVGRITKVFQSGGCNLTLPPGVASREAGLRHNFIVDQWWRDSASDFGCDRGDGQWFDQLIVDTYQNIMKNAAGPDHHVPI